MYDDDGHYIEDYQQVREGGIFELSTDTFRVIGGEVRLIGTGFNKSQWLEISKKSLEAYFEEVKE